MKIDTQDYRIREGESVDLGKRPTRIDAPFASKDDYEKALKQRVERLHKLQEMFYAADSHALLIVLQGMDTAGKDGVIEHVLSGMNQQGCEVHAFKQPSEAELHHDFLWRCVRVLPERGRVGVFNRSYYEEVVVVRVHPEFLDRQGAGVRANAGGKDFWKDRYRSIVGLERHLQRNATRIVKLFLHLSEEEQRQRLLARIDEPAKNWKFSAGDVAERARWKDYLKAYEQCLGETSTAEAPWFVVPADDKPTARLIAAEIIAGAMEALDLKYPELSGTRRAELEAIRRQLQLPGPLPRKAR